MGSCHAKELIEFTTKNFKKVRVIGVLNPSVIVTFKKKSYVIYKPYGQKNEGKYVICIGTDRYSANSVEEIKTIIK